MYRYVVIDDEALIRKAIVKKISSLELPLAWVGEAEDGEEGLALVERERPDIVLTDMRMPVMDGVSFLQAVTERRAEAQLIVVSGYSDFEYTREAITSSVSGYILKPFDDAELRQALGKAIERIEQIRLTRRNAMEIEFELDLVRFSAWLCRQAEDESAPFPWPEAYSSEPLRRLLAAGSYVVAVLLEPSAGQADGLSRSANGTAATTAASVPEGCARFPHPDLPGVRVLVCSDPAAGRQAAAAKMNAWLADLAKRSDPIVAVSEECDAALRLPRALREALALLEERPFGATSGVFRPATGRGHAGGTAAGTEPAGGSGEWQWSRIEDFLYEIEEGNEAQASRLAEELFAGFRSDAGFTLRSVKRICRALYHRVVERLGAAHRMAPDTRFETLPLLGQEADSGALERHFLRFAREAAGLSPARTAKTGDLAQQIKQFIDRSYAQPLTLEEVADRFFLHPVYLSMMFKEKTGETFQDYLRRVRMERAKHLLVTTKYRIDRISVMIGYENTKYFYKVFKKETGFTPADYRQRQSEG